jgi:enoyl-[acyl-carrier protein] reductase I
MLKLDLTGKRALVAGIADDRGFGYAIAESLRAAGASVCAATWPPAYRSFTTLLRRAAMHEAGTQAGDGPLFEHVYPLDARYDTAADVPEEVATNRRYRELDRFSVQDLALRLQEDFGPQPLDIVVHAIANGPEVARPLLETSREGYIAAVSSSAYSFVSMAQRLGPLLRPDGSLLCLSFIAAERVIPGYGGGMASAKAALECDTRVLAFELGRRHGVRVNCISAAPWPSRAAAAIGFIEHMANHVATHAPVPKRITPADVGAAAVFLASPLASAITGTTLHVDHGSHCMGIGFSAAEMPRAEEAAV